MGVEEGEEEVRVLTAPWTGDGVVGAGCLVEVEVQEPTCLVVAGEAETVVALFGWEGVVQRGQKEVQYGREEEIQHGREEAVQHGQEAVQREWEEEVQHG